MKGWFGNTDFDWYQCLAEHTPLDEVNFWQPSAKRQAARLDPGTPFFFKLKSPHYAIAGFGYVSKYTVLPTDLAWETFGVKNGAETFAEMRERIARYRASPMQEHENPDIGCFLVQQPTFFSPQEWIPQPRDWPKNVVQGMGYDLTASEGRRVWEECRLRIPAAMPASGFLTAEHPRYGEPVLVRPRLGQGSFRIAVLDAYDRACAVTNEHSLPVLEAAHIQPFTADGPHDPRNGLLLRSDLHRLFDRGFVTVDPELTFRVSSRLRGRWNNGRVYYEFDGRKVRVPDREDLQPDRKLLAWHSREVFVA